jgi:hypothetical protein
MAVGPRPLTPAQVGTMPRLEFLKLRLGKHTERRAWCSSGKRPQDIPSGTREFHSEKKGFGDWLGTGNKRGGGR